MAKSGNMTALILLPLLLLGCSRGIGGSNDEGSSQTQESEAGPKIAWKAGPNDSTYFVDETENLKFVRRCWKREAGYDCLNAHSVKLVSGYFEFSRFKQAELSIYRYDRSSNMDLGYSCELASNNILTEKVHSARGLVLSRVSHLDGTGANVPLSSEAVKAALGNKPIPNGASYFDCPSIASAVTKQGPTAIIADTIRYEHVMF